MPHAIFAMLIALYYAGAQKYLHFCQRHRQISTYIFQESAEPPLTGRH